jgi:hypothetical protein
MVMNTAEKLKCASCEADKPSAVTVSAPVVTPKVISEPPSNEGSKVKQSALLTKLAA